MFAELVAPDGANALLVTTPAGVWVRLGPGDVIQFVSDTFETIGPLLFIHRDSGGGWLCKDPFTGKTTCHLFSQATRNLRIELLRKAEDGAL